MNMIGFLLVNLYAFLIIIATTILFFSKNRLKQVEDETYKKFLIVNIFTCVSGILLGMVVTPNFTFENRIIVLFNKLYLIFLLLWIIILTFYIVYVSLKNKDNVKKCKFIFDILAIISIFIVILLPLKADISGINAVSSGLAVDFTYIVFILGLLTQIVFLLINYKDFKNKKYVPLYLLILLIILVFIIMLINPSLNYIINPVFIFIAFIMFHTIENPDKKILEEFHEAKEISDNANEEKSMFLYNMTNEIRQIIFDIDKTADSILDETDNKKVNIELIDDYSREIKANTAKFNTMINEIFDISQVDINNIKIYTDKYNVKLIIKELVQKYNNKCREKGVSFRSRIDSSIPEYLYGDSVSLKKVLNTILDNSFNYTDSGYVELDVDVILKNNVCRLVINIEDSGVGMKAIDLSKALNNNEVDNEVDDYDLKDTLYNSRKLITLMGGTIIASSVYGKGTKIKIVLDQKVVELDNKLKKYEKVYDKKKVLLVDDSEASGKILSKMLSDTNVDLNIVTTGKEALDKIRNKEKYDLILLDEQMQPLDGITVMKKLKDIRNFNTDVVLLTRNNNYEYNEDYLKYGFSNYLLKPINKEQLFNIINKK